LKLIKAMERIADYINAKSMAVCSMDQGYGAAYDLLNPEMGLVLYRGGFLTNQAEEVSLARHVPEEEVEKAVEALLAAPLWKVRAVVEDSEGNLDLLEAELSPVKVVGDW